MVTNREKAPFAQKIRGSIRADLGTGLWLEGNVWTTQKGIEAPASSTMRRPHTRSCAVPTS